MRKPLCWAAVSFLLVSCASGLPMFPIQKFFVMDTNAMTCREYLRTSLDSKPVYQTEHPISFCNGFVGITPSDYLKGDNWVKNVNQDYVCKLKK